MRKHSVCAESGAIATYPTSDAKVNAAHATLSQDLLRGIWRENPVFVHVMGLCPALAVTNTVSNGLAMGLATLFVLCASSVLISAFRKFIPSTVRLSTYVLIIATFVTIVDMVMEATVPAVQKALGAFLYLIVVNCMILGRQEAFASRQPVVRSFLDALGTGIGFLLALFLMGTIREVIGYGSFLGQDLFGSRYQPWTVMVLPPGGFFTIGAILLGLNWVRDRRLVTQPLRDRASTGRAAEGAG